MTMTDQIKEIADRFAAMIPEDGWFSATIVYKVEGGVVTRADETKIVCVPDRQIQGSISDVEFTPGVKYCGTFDGPSEPFPGD